MASFQGKLKDRKIPPEVVRKWLDDMKTRGLAKSDADCARLLEVTPLSVIRWKKAGVPEEISGRTLLAFSALLNGLGPYEG